MILNSRHVLLILTIAAVSTACAPPASKAPVDNTKAAGAEPATGAPSAGELFELDQRANEAYIKGDGKFFENILSDKLVMQSGGSRLRKTDVVQMISGVNCEVKEDWSLTEPQMSRIDDDTYVLSYKTTGEGSCTANGKSDRLPSPVRAATVWIRSGNGWQVAFHGENPIVDPAAPAATEVKDEGDKDASTAAIAAMADAGSSGGSTDAPGTDALMEAERSIWEAWRTHDAERINNLTAREIAFVNIFGTFFADKAAAVEDWTSAACDVESFTLKNGVGTFVSPTVGILTLTGTVDGTCGGQDIGGQEIYGTSVYVKDGEAWKWAFGFNSPR